MRKKCIIEELQKFVEKENGHEKFNDHLLLGISIMDNGIPSGLVSKLQANPIAALGMLDLLLEKLQQTREETLKQIENIKEKMEESSKVMNSPDFKNFNKIFDKMSEHDKGFFDDIHRRMLKALMEKNEEEMRRIVDEVKAYGKKKFGSDFDTDSGFNLDDFKNGF